MVSEYTDPRVLGCHKVTFSIQDQSARPNSFYSFFHSISHIQELISSTYGIDRNEFMSNM